MVNFPNHYKERRGHQSIFSAITHNRLFDISLLTTEKRKHNNSTQHNRYDVTESYPSLMQTSVTHALILDIPGSLYW